MRQSIGSSYVLLIALALTIAACGGKSDGGDAGTGAPQAAPQAADDGPVRVSKTLVVDGRTRSYLLNLPPGYNNAKAVALVIALHGGGGNATQFENTARLTVKANAARFAVVYPNGTSAVLGLQTWNGGGCCGSAVTEQVDDVRFIRQLLSDLSANYRIDTRRVYATGHSNGGIMSHRLACELSDRVAAIAPNAAALMVNPCTPTRAVPILHMHSKLDQNVPIAGGTGSGVSGVSFEALDVTMNRWVIIDGCAPTPQVTLSAGKFTRTTWSACANPATVELLLTDDGGHGWPGGLPGSAAGDIPSTAINANDELWAFFQRYALP